MISARLIQSGYCDAATNMAIDEALFLSYAQGRSFPALRIYGWKPASISIGCFQNAQDVLNLEAFKPNASSFVRRPTGGGIIYHHHEITYSLILAPNDIGLSGNVKESFEKITSFLFLAYSQLNLKAAFAKDMIKNTAAPTGRADFCFARNEEYDILIGGKKIGGNAQKRKKNIILQHGSIPLSFNREPVRPFLKDPETLESLTVASLNELTQDNIEFENFASYLKEAFSRHFNARLIESDLTNEEKNLTDWLRRNKYEQPEWNTHRRVETKEIRS